MKKEHKRISIFSIYYVVLYALLALATTQIIPYLSSIGYDASQRSMMLATGSVLGIIVQILVGFLSDRYRTIKKIIIPVFIAFGICSYLFFSYSVQVFIYHFILVAVSHSLEKTLFSYSDSWVMESGSEINQHFGLIRGFGSIGWILGTSLVSQIIGAFGYQRIASTSLLVMTVAILIALFLNDVSKPQISATKITFKDINVLLKDKTYMLALLLLLCFTAITTLDSISVIDKILVLGGNESHVALRYSIAAAVEIPFFFLGKKIYKKLGYFNLLKLSGCVYFMTHFVMGITDNPMIIVSTAFFQGLCFSPFLLANRNLVFDLSPDHLKSTGQLFANAFLSGLTGLFVPLIFGYITTNISASISLFSGCVFAAMGLLLIRPLKKRVEHTI